MSDLGPQPSAPSSAAAATDTRTLTIIVYGLYLGSVVTAGGAGLVGVVLA